MGILVIICQGHIAATLDQFHAAVLHGHLWSCPHLLPAQHATIRARLVSCCLQQAITNTSAGTCCLHTQCRAKRPSDSGT